MADAPNRLQRRLNPGGQDQFYLEGHISMCVPQEDNGLLLYSSTQHPDEVQHLVANATHRAAKDVVCICRRMGGAFGGKESQAATIACIAALMTVKTGRPCKLRLDRDVDMILTGKRHDFVVDYDVGFDDTGRIAGIDFTFDQAMKEYRISLLQQTTAQVITSDLEGGNLKSAKRREVEATTLYRDAELVAIKAQYLSETRDLLAGGDEAADEEEGPDNPPVVVLDGYYVTGACGASCSDNKLFWLKGGTEYAVGLKSGKEKVIAFANSIIENSH